MKKTRIIAAALSVVTVFTLIAFASCSQKPSSDSGLTETGAKTGISPLTVHETEPISETKDSTQTGSPVETGNSVETEPETGVPSETQTEERVPLTPAQLSELVAETDSTFGGGISMNYETFNWEILDEAINNFNYENYSEARRIICDADNRIVEKFNNDTSDLSQITRKCESTCIDGNYAFAVLYYDPEGTLKYVNTHFYDLYRGKSLELSDALKAVKLTEEKLREKLSATGAQLREDSKIEGFVPYPYGIYDVFVSSGENGVDTYKLTIPEARSELFTCHASGNESKEAMFDVTNKATYKDAVIAERFALPRTSSDELNAEIIKDFFEFADKNAVFSDKREELAYYVNYNIRRTYGLERIEVHYITFDEYGKKSDEIKKYFCETTTGAYWKDGDVEPEDIIKTLALNFADRLQMFVGDVSAERPLKCDIYSIAAAMYLCKRTAIDPVSTTYYSPQEMNITNYETERIFVELLGIDFVLPEENQRYKSEGNLYITLGDEKSRFSMGSVSTVLNRSLSEIKIIGNRVTVDAVCEYAARFGFSYGKKAMRYEFEFDGLELKLISARTEKSINDPEPVTVKLIEKSPDGKYASFDDAVRAELVFDNTEDISFSESLKKQICDFALAYKNIAGSCLSTESIDSIPYNDFTFNSGFRIESCCFNCTLDNGNKVWLYTLSAIRSTTDNKYNVYIIKIDVFTDEDPTYISLSDDGIKAVLDNDPRFCGTYNERHLVCDGWKNVDFGTIIKEAGYDKVLAYCGFNNKDALPYIAVIAGKSITEKLDGKFILYYKNVTLMFYNIETGLFSEKCIELKDIQNILGYSLKSDDDYLYIILTTKNGDEEQKIKYCLKYNGSSDPKLIEGEPKIVFEGDSNAYYITSIIETEKWVIERDSGGSIYTTRKSDGEKKTLYSSIPYKYGERGTSAQLYSIISEKYLIYQIFGWEWSVGFGVFNLETEKNWVVECGAYLHEIFGEYIILQDNDELKYAKVTAPFVQFLLIDNLWEYDSVYIDSEMKRFFVSPESSGYKAYLFEVYYFERTSGKCVPTSYFRIYGKENDCRFTLTGGYALVFSYDKEEFIYKKLYY